VIVATASSTLLVGVPALGDDNATRQFREKWGFATSQSLIDTLANDPTANREYGYPLTDAEVDSLEMRGRIDSDLVDLHAHIETNSNKFGGVYLDNRAGGEVVVQTVRSTTDSNRQEAKSLIPDRWSVRFEEVENSYGELASTHEAINNLLRERHMLVTAVTGIDQMLGENVLRIRVLPEDLDSVRTFLRDEFRPGLFRFEAGGYDRPTACVDRFECWHDPLRGGLNYTPDGCTIGFMVYNTSSQRRLLTAGHCLIESGNATRYHDGNSIGDEGPNSFYDGSWSDFGILKMQGAQGMSGHKIYRNANNKAHNISAQDGPSTLGQPANMSGRASGLEFGEVVSVNHTSNWGGGFYLFYMRVADYENQEGDSGAPVFFEGTAMGIQSGCVSDPGEDCTTDNSQDSVFSTIDELWGATDGSNAGSEFNMKVCRSGDAETEC
jgi:hypothetical protein